MNLIIFDNKPLYSSSHRGGRSVSILIPADETLSLIALLHSRFVVGRQPFPYPITEELPVTREPSWESWTGIRRD